jgi:glycosyltransferase involved in cell wall biosynthesis
MKILLTLHHELNINAGAASVVMRLAEEYRKLGHEVDILSYDDMPKTTRKIADILFPFVVAWQVLTKYRSFDAVDASSGDAWLAFSLPRLNRRQLRVTHSHGLEHLSARREIDDTQRQGRPLAVSKRIWRYGLRLAQVWCSFARADLCFVLNQGEREFLKGRGIADASIALARLGVSVPVLDALPPESPGVTRVAQLGSYTIRKGVKVTAAALADVMKEFPDLRMVFAGTGASAAVVLDDYPAGLHNRIEVIPRYTNDALTEILRDAAILLMPSLFEGYGIAKMEGMARGLVPIVSDDPGTASDMVDGVNAVIVSTGDAQALKMAIGRLISDPPFRRRLAAAGLETASQAQWSVVAAQRIDIYRNYLERRM